MNARLLKYISIPLIAVVNFIVGFVPFLVISRQISRTKARQKRLSSTTSSHNQSNSQQNNVVSSRVNYFLSFANYFCGGVFLATCFVGLYPSVVEKFNKIYSESNSNINVTAATTNRNSSANSSKSPSSSSHHFPWEALTLIGGFFIVWLLEVTVHWCIHCAHEKQKPVEVNPDKLSNKQHNIKDGNMSPNTPITPLSPNAVSLDATAHDQLIPQSSTSPVGIKNGHSHHDEHPHGDHHHGNHDNEELSDQEHGDGHSHMPMSGNLLGSVMLTFALGSHSIIEGLGFAMIEQFGMTLNMLITVLIHESVCAFSLGVNLAGKSTPTKVAGILLGTFSILIPVGLGLGMILLNAQVNNLVTAVLQGIAAGTFLYVVFMEILANDRDHAGQSHKLLKIFLMLVGFAVISSMKAIHTMAESNESSMNNTLTPIQKPRST